MCTEGSILILQFCASILMGFDYFFDENKRNRVNDLVRNAIQPINNQNAQDIRLRTDYIVQQWIYIATPLVLIFLTCLFLKLLPNIIPLNSPWIAGATILILLGLFLTSFSRLLGIAVGLIIPITLATSSWTITGFIVHCPKGTIFALGFIILMLSFACRYSSL